ncbi:MAG: hypothetical protein E5V75_35045 [Mesorhizobium sp.]|nr:MAG: hypothetical protein E5V75_35045 [Mesorhizobium sp.]
MSAGKALSLPLRIEDGESARTTIFIDANGIAIGGCYGEHHREHADIIVAAVNAAHVVRAPSQREKLN